MALPALKVKVPAKAEAVSVHSEQILNFLLVIVTGYHEWGNEVGYAAIPCAIAILLHIVCEALTKKE